MAAPTDESLLDLVDDQDQAIGVVRRGEVFDRHAGFRVAHVFVFDAGGRLLVQQLGAARTRNPLRWGSSVAGYLHAGETYDEAATRRLFEELGLSTPLDEVAYTSMVDQGCTKFIRLYRTVADAPRITEPGHIETLRFATLRELDHEVRSAAASFTETFLHLYRHFRSVLGRPVPSR